MIAVTTKKEIKLLKSMIEIVSIYAMSNLVNDIGGDALIQLADLIKCIQSQEESLNNQ